MSDDSVIDLRGIPTSECPICGSNIFSIKAIFDEEYELSMYMLDAECAMCHTRLTAPTPLDIPMEM